MSAETSDSTKRFVFEKQFSGFLISRIENFGGSIKLQHITGHLSQVKPEIREVIGTSKVDILNFIKKHNHIFNFENDVVTLINPTKNVYDNDYESTNNSLPNKISNGIGVIIKLFPAYGFIKAKEPIKTSVYFRATAFSNSSHEDVDLTDFGLNIGTMVNFNAFKEKKDNFTSKYCATKVWKNNKVDIENNIIYKPRKNRESGLYDSPTLDGEGVIQKVFQKLGFIAANGDKNNTVFFHKNRVVNYDNIVDLTEVFKEGDFVEFSAHRTTKPDAKARWEAMKVWNRSGGNVKKKKQKDDIASKTSSVSSSTEFLSQLQSDSTPTRLINNYMQKSSTREMIHDQSGKICPRSNGAVIKFGENFTLLADGDSSIYYICGAQVTDISWEFSEGDVVKFDAVKIKSAPGWKAVLVWIGEKPNIILPTTLGDFSVYSDEEIDELSEEMNSLVSGNYVSKSSRSSQKSVSMKSEFSDLKSIASYESTSNLQNSPIESGIDEIKRGNHESSDVHSTSPWSSESNLSSSSGSKYFKSKDKLKSEQSDRKSHNVHSISPCRSQSNLSTSKDKLESKKSNRKKFNISPCSSLSNVSSFSKSKVPNKESKTANTNKIKSNTSKSIMNLGNIPQSENNMKIQSPSSIDYLNKDDGEFESYIVDSNERKTAQLNDHEFTDTFEDSKTNNLKNVNNSKSTDVGVNTADIKLFQNIVGEITKVYTMFAEIKCSEIPKPVPFYGNLFYFDRNSMEDLDVSDLRKVLKVGDTIQANYFEITDDSGQLWPKVSLVWKGSKPNSKHVKEMTPNNFIQENGLSVTLKEKPNYVLPVEQKQSVKKFLTSYDDISTEGKDDEHISPTESCFETDDDCDKMFQHPISSEDQEKLLADNIKVLSDMISRKMLKNKDLFVDSKILYLETKTK